MSKCDCGAASCHGLTHADWCSTRKSVGLYETIANARVPEYAESTFKEIVDTFLARESIPEIEGARCPKCNHETIYVGRSADHACGRCDIQWNSRYVSVEIGSPNDQAYSHALLSGEISEDCGRKYKVISRWISYGRAVFEMHNIERGAREGAEQMKSTTTCPGCGEKAFGIKEKVDILGLICGRCNTKWRVENGKIRDVDTSEKCDPPKSVLDEVFEEIRRMKK